MFYRFLSCSYNLFENNIQHMPGKTEEDQQNPDRQQITWPRSELGTSQIQFYTSLYGDTQYELTLINWTTRHVASILQKHILISELTILHLLHQLHITMSFPSVSGICFSSSFRIMWTQPISCTNRRTWCTIGVSHDSEGQT